MAGRISREGQSRESNKRVESYAPPELLPRPPNDDQYVYRYIRKSFSYGQMLDTRNMARRAQQGWEMVRKEEFPEIARILDPLGTVGGDYIENGGLILAKLPTNKAEQIRAYNNRKAKAQVRAVDNNFFSLKDRGVEVFRDPESRVFTDRKG